jgi:hypothetical protein
MKKIKFTYIIWILYYLTIFFILLHNSFSYLDPDLGWHLKVGEQILNEGTVPSLEYYNYTLEGRTWVDHEWLINAVTYWIYNNLGYLALNIFFALIVVTALIILNILVKKYVLKERNSFIIIIIFQTLAIIASLPHLGVRMQEITLLNISLLFLIIYHFNENKNFKTLFLFIPLFWLWASMHAGFLTGIFILFFWAIVKFIENILSRYKNFDFINYEKKITKKQIATFSLFALGGVIATLITPYGFKLYQFLSYYKNNYYLTKIKEWLPFYYLPIQYWQLLYAAIIISIILLSFFYVLRKNKGKITLWNVAISLIFFALALKSKRHFPLFFIVSFPMLVSFFSSFLNLPNSNFFDKKWAKQYFIIKPYIVMAFLIIISTKLININFISNPFDAYGDKYPRDAVIFLKDHPEYNNLKLFNRYGWGGYLVWTMPERKIFIDGRLPMLPFAGHTFLNEYSEFFNKEKVGNKLKQYNIGLILIPNKKDYIELNWFEKYFLLLNEEKVNKYENHLKNYLEQSNNWELVYSDTVSNIYAKP